MTRLLVVYVLVAVLVSLAVLVLVWTAGPCDVRYCGGLS